MYYTNRHIVSFNTVITLFITPFPPFWNNSIGGTGPTSAATLVLARGSGNSICFGYNIHIIPSSKLSQIIFFIKHGALMYMMYYT